MSSEMKLCAARTLRLAIGLEALFRKWKVGRRGCCRRLFSELAMLRRLLEGDPGRPETYVFAERCYRLELVYYS